MYKYRCNLCSASGPSQKVCFHCLTAFCTDCGKTVAGLDIGSTDRNTCPVCKNRGRVRTQDSRRSKIK